MIDCGFEGVGVWWGMCLTCDRVIGFGVEKMEEKLWGWVKGSRATVLQV